MIGIFPGLAGSVVGTVILSSFKPSSTIIYATLWPSNKTTSSFSTSSNPSAPPISSIFQSLSSTSS